MTNSIIVPTREDKIITIMTVIHNTTEDKIKELMKSKKNGSVLKSHRYYNNLSERDLTDQYNLAIAHIRIERSQSLSPEAKNLFLAYAKDAGNWSGNPLVGGNITSNKQTDGYLTALKKKGLIETWIDEGHTWMKFTEKGLQTALAAGVDLYPYYEHYRKPIQPSMFYLKCRDRAMIEFSVGWDPEQITKIIDALANGKIADIDIRSVIGILVDVRKGIEKALAEADDVHLPKRSPAPPTGTAEAMNAMMSNEAAKLEIISEEKIVPVVEHTRRAPKKRK